MDMDAAVAELGASMGFGEEGGGEEKELDEGLGGEGEKETPAPEVGKEAPQPTVPGAEKAPSPGAASPATPPSAAPGPSPAPSAPPAPGTWRQAAAAKWASIDPEVQAEILKREDDARNGIRGYKQDSDNWKATAKVLEPYLPVLRAHGINPIEQIHGLMDLNHRLATGSPQEKIQTLTDLAKRFSIDLTALDPASQPYVDPAVQELQSQVREMNSQWQRAQSNAMAQSQHQVAAQVQREIQAFASDPLNRYFNELEGDLVPLIRANPSLTLKEAYEKAVWANPATREKEMTRLKAESDAEAARKVAETQAAAAARTAAARKATGANVKSSAHSGHGAVPLGSMDETMAQVLANIRRREA